MPKNDLLITVFLFRLLMYLRACPALVGDSTSPAAELTLFEAAPIREEPVQPWLRIVALCAVLVCCLCAGVVASSANGLSSHLKQMQEKTNSDAQKFVGTWVLTVGDIYDLKNSSVPDPFRNLPKGLSRDLPLVEVVIEVRDGEITGKRLLYGYALRTDSASPVVERGEVRMVNFHIAGTVLSGELTSSEGKRLPGGWELKLTGDQEAEVRATGNEESQSELGLKLHRLQAKPRS